MAKTENGETVLHSAAKNIHCNIYIMTFERWLRPGSSYERAIELLLEGGVDVTAKTDYGWTALQYAVISGFESIVRLLLEKGADVATKTGNGETLLHLAASHGSEVANRLSSNHTLRKCPH